MVCFLDCKTCHDCWDCLLTVWLHPTSVCHPNLKPRSYLLILWCTRCRRTWRPRWQNSWRMTSPSGPCLWGLLVPLEFSGGLWGQSPRWYQCQLWKHQTLLQGRTLQTIKALTWLSAQHDNKPTWGKRHEERRAGLLYSNKHFLLRQTAHQHWIYTITNASCSLLVRVNGDPDSVL